MSEKITLRAQISALRILINAAKRRQTLKQSEVDHLSPALEAAIDSLEWLARNEPAIKAASKNGRKEDGGS